MYNFDLDRHFDKETIALISKLQEIGIIVTISSNGVSTAHYITISRLVVQKPSVIQRILRFGGLGSENTYVIQEIAFRQMSLPERMSDLEMLLKSTMNKYYDYGVNKRWMMSYEK